MTIRLVVLAEISAKIIIAAILGITPEIPNIKGRMRQIEPIIQFTQEKIVFRDEFEPNALYLRLLRLMIDASFSDGERR